MKKLTLGIVLVILVLTLAGCGAAQRAPTAMPASQPAPAPEMVQAAEAPKSDNAYGGSTASTELLANAVTDRKIVRNADLSLVVTDAAVARDSIVAAAEGMGGFVADANAWREGEQLRARLVVRVPAESLDSLLSTVRNLAIRVLTDNVKGQDVTEEFSDLGARLVNLEATEAELRELLSEIRQRTQKAEDVLTVYRELTGIRAQIEQVKGRMQYLDNMADLATVTVDLIPDVLAKPVVAPGWRPAEQVRNAGRALVRSLQGLADAAIWIALYVVPIILVILIPIVLVILVIRALVRRSRRPRVTPASGGTAS